MTTSFLIVRLGSLGDLIHTLPAVAAIRRVYPDSVIDWLVEAPHRELLDLVPILSSVVVLEGRDFTGWLATSRTLRARRYGVALDFQGLLKSAALARFSGARSVVGFDRKALREPAARLFYTNSPKVGEGRHVIDKNLAMVSALLETNEALQPTAAARATIDFPLRDIQSRALEQLRGQVTGSFALVNPGAAWPNKRWPASRFGAVARSLHADQRLPSIVLWGPGEVPLASDVVAASGDAAWLSPPTSIADLVALVRGASLMVSGDTGPAHIAAAVGTPLVGIYGPTRPARNGPWSAGDITVSRDAICQCHHLRRCKLETMCLMDIQVDEVLNAIERRLALEPTSV